MKSSLLFACVAIAGSASAQTVRLRFAPAVGHTYAYRMSSEMGKTGAMKPMMSMSFTMRIASLKNGLYTVVTKVTDMKMPGQQMTRQMIQQMNASASTAVIDSTGKTKSTGGVGGGAGNGFATFPTRPLRVGESWSSSTQAGNMMVQTSYKLVKLQRMSGTQAALIDITTQLPPMGRPMPAPPVAHLWVDVATGLPLRLESSTNAGGQSFRTTMIRV